MAFATHLLINIELFDIAIEIPIIFYLVKGVQLWLLMSMLASEIYVIVTKLSIYFILKKTAAQDFLYIKTF